MMKRPSAPHKYANRINWEEIQDLLRVVRHHSFAAAAREKGVSRSAVHKSVGALERRLGVQLIVRSVRPATLTETGKMVCSAARQFDDALRAILAGHDVGELMAGETDERISVLARQMMAWGNELTAIAKELRFNKRE